MEFVLKVTGQDIHLGNNIENSVETNPRGMTVSKVQKDGVMDITIKGSDGTTLCMIREKDGHSVCKVKQNSGYTVIKEINTDGQSIYEMKRTNTHV
jgi:hypothetical protein